MTINRYNAKRDENEPLMVDMCNAYGRHVTRINGPGVPDLLVIRPDIDIPVFVVDNLERLQDLLDQNIPMMLVEVKMPGKKLNKVQREWHAAATSHPDAQD